MDEIDSIGIDPICELIWRVLDLHGNTPIERSKVTPASLLRDDLGFDSLGMVALVVELQRTYRVRIPEQDVPAWITVADVHVYMRTLIK